ncbi:hypothetical protein P170DRAFT_418946 [Aspergillus steynii IBT 23096]|uniref:Wax synthase domain-containing protein n=1 Tax=Aspergillus steynii IBT 23096 TaxID=1392250 RepID=A0A2I2FRD0_9EURO|nr:uncharacterized protein P170DRAFT_418946 [Aspergillus steynii IBT 23096]PLB43167.1 hypothetical protein P170DRAFT_418946 [Aspergillus steynii IBT 23096]
MADPLPPSYLHILRSRHAQIESLIHQGHPKPVLLWHLIAFFLVLPASALLISHRTPARYLRPFILVLILGFSVEALQSRRILLGGNGYIVGLIAAWWSIWVMTLLVFHDAQRDFRRIERRPLEREDDRRESAETRSRHADGVRHAVASGGPPNEEYPEPLVWQTYPGSWSHRLNWVLGLLLNLRGPEWNWRISSVGPLPASIRTQLDPKHRRSRSREQCKKLPAYQDGKTRIRAVVFEFFKAYLALDVIKVLMMRDPYFWGIIPLSFSPPPAPISYILPPIPAVFRVYRLALSGIGIHVALVCITALNPLFFLGLSRAFPNASRALTAVPLDAPWLYPESFGPFIASVLDHGLAGCWSRWWHQLFRFGFLSTAQWLISWFPRRLATHTGFRRYLLTLIVFSLSGFIHASGSYTQFGDTRPISGTFIFFLLQGAGVMIQDLASKNLIPALFTTNSAPRWLRRTANATFAIGWLIFSGGYIADDFSKGGLWLTEPLPTSPLRGLGFGLGVEGEGWWCWSEPWFQWWDDGTFWGRGLRFM